jgi:hypothetical protein
MNIQQMKTDYLRMGKNFMTPNILSYEIVENRLVELSSGFGIDNSPIWGVTEMLYENSKWGTTKNSKMFRTPKEARKYYKLLINN